MLDTILELESQTLEHIVTLHSQDDLIAYKNDILGKNGSLNALLKGIKDLSPEERGTIGKKLNDIRDSILRGFDMQKKQIESREIHASLSQQWEDVTVPLPSTTPHIHPLTRVRLDVEDTFRRMGFDIYESPEVTTEYANFDAVNVPINHPARDMQDTFWLG